MTSSWWTVKRQRLASAISEIRDKETIIVVEDVFSFAPDDNIPGVHLIHKDSTYFDNEEATADIFINQGYDHDIDAIWRVTQTGRAGITSCWFWDNHHLQKSTMRGSMTADVSFYAHGYASDYRNDFGISGGFVPLCPIYWSESVIDEVYRQAQQLPRSDRLYGGYNSYAEFPERDQLLEQIKAALPAENLIRQWKHGTPWSEHGYYGLSHPEKLREWCSFKIALCVSFGRNTTIRMFEALVGGQIPVVVGEVPDLDAIISSEDQARLPIIRVPRANVDLIVQAYRDALARFDHDGEVGVARRRAYVRERHMPRSRLLQMIEAIRAIEAVPS